MRELSQGKRLPYSFMTLGRGKQPNHCLVGTNTATSDVLAACLVIRLNSTGGSPTTYSGFLVNFSLPPSFCLQLPEFPMTDLEEEEDI
jgi:hypothetical protein